MSTTRTSPHFAELLLAAKLRARRDPLRARSDFSEDIQQVNAVLHNPRVKKLSKVAAYREWLRKNQPCVFGRAAATNKQVFICLLEEQQVLTMPPGGTMTCGRRSSTTRRCGSGGPLPKG